MARRITTRITIGIFGGLVIWCGVVAAQAPARGTAPARPAAQRPDANLLQLMGTNPQFAQAYTQRYSMQRLTEQMLRNSGVDPSTLEKTQDEKDAEEAQQMVADSLNEGQVTQPNAAPGSPSPGGAPGSAPPPAAAANSGSPASLLDASQDQAATSSAMAPQTPSGQIPGAPQPGIGAVA